jgi:hypothetical protein
MWHTANVLYKKFHAGGLKRKKASPCDFPVNQSLETQCSGGKKEVALRKMENG